MPHILTEMAEDDTVAILTLDHERRRNALSHALVEEVLAALQGFRAAKARVVILRARPGAKVFSAGHDVDELPATRRDPPVPSSASTRTGADAASASGTTGPRHPAAAARAASVAGGASAATVTVAPPAASNRAAT